MDNGGYMKRIFFKKLLLMSFVLSGSVALSMEKPDQESKQAATMVVHFLKILSNHLNEPLIVDLT